MVERGGEVRRWAGGTRWFCGEAEQVALWLDDDECSGCRGGGDERAFGVEEGGVVVGDVEGVFEDVFEGCELAGDEVEFEWLGDG